MEQVNQNLFMMKSFTYKDLLLKKSYNAVASSMLSQFLLLFLCIFFANMNLLDAREWFRSTLQIFLHLNTWFFLIMFLCLMFFQCLICAKDYIVSNNTFTSTRFQQFINVFSLHNFILLSLHIIVGGILVWQLLSVIRPAPASYQYLMVDCKKNNHQQLCLAVGGNLFFLVLSGFWIGFYYFFKVYIGHKQLMFPVIQQNKSLQFRNNIIYIFYNSFTKSFWPALYFTIFLYFYGLHLKNSFVNFFNFLIIIKIADDDNVIVIDYEEHQQQPLSLLFSFNIWLFAGFYFFNMNLMRFFFRLFLTEAATFPLIKTNHQHVLLITLQDAIVLKERPIVQNLACQDLFLLSRWSPQRRQIVFSLSEIGNHPYVWNDLIEKLLKLFQEYNELLSRSTTTTIIPSPSSPVDEIISAPAAQQQQQQQQHYHHQYIRSDNYLNVVEVSYSTPPIYKKLQQLKSEINNKLNKFVNSIKTLLGINYLFGELPAPQANIQKCLSNGQIIIWACQGIANLYGASLTEDKYGVAQKDLPLVLSTLVSLKQNLDKLIKMPTMSKRLTDDFNYKMKNAVNSAVKRSLFNLCRIYGEYFKEFPISQDVLLYLQTNIVFNNNTTLI